jgi:hypothetical protein
VALQSAHVSFAKTSFSNSHFACVNAACKSDPSGARGGRGCGSWVSSCVPQSGQKELWARETVRDDATWGIFFGSVSPGGYTLCYETKQAGH